MKSIILAAFFFLLFTGCSKEETDRTVKRISTKRNQSIPHHIRAVDNLKVYAADTEPAMGIQFKQEGNFGSTDDIIVTIGGPSGEVARADEKGRVFVPDRQQFTIHVFNPDGSYLTQIGREGKGPGEFQSLTSMKIDSENLYVYDSLQLRILVFSLESLTLSHTVNLNVQTWSNIDELLVKGPSHYFIRRDGTFLVRFAPSIKYIENIKGEEYTYSYFIINKEGEISSDEIFEQRGRPYFFTTFKGSRFSVTLPFTGKSLVALSSDDHIYAAWTDDFLIKVYSAEGKYLQAFYYPFKKSVIHRKELIKRYDIGYDTPQMQYIKNTELPERWPALHSMHMDDKNRLWVSTIVDDPDIYQWWILSEQGELLARFTWPGNRSIEDIKNGYLYTRETEEETRLQTIVRYRIEME